MVSTASTEVSKTSSPGSNPGAPANSKRRSWVAEVVETIKQKKGAISQFVRETREEMQKVSFPSASDVRGTTIIVIINVIFFAVFLFLIDRLWTYVLDWIAWSINWLIAAF